jgi:hypothetical protein
VAGLSGVLVILGAWVTGLMKVMSRLLSRRRAARLRIASPWAPRVAPFLPGALRGARMRHAADRDERRN